MVFYGIWTDKNLSSRYQVRMYFVFWSRNLQKLQLLEIYSKICLVMLFLGIYLHNCWEFCNLLGYCNFLIISIFLRNIYLQYICVRNFLQFFQQVDQKCICKVIILYIFGLFSRIELWNHKTMYFIYLGNENCNFCKNTRDTIYIVQALILYNKYTYFLVGYYNIFLINTFMGIISFIKALFNIGYYNIFLINTL
eukprot:TRINITY_DN5009_c0_g1_i2.p2 TRINITY_DN5009_c0_g1~~TRINITY_DN5009_c0_g1_i2.p2  ORF type:complete len:195 (-),score=-12.17 TRINITY_DN5009_c0_g1_i2:268-852(-)